MPRAIWRCRLTGARRSRSSLGQAAATDLLNDCIEHGAYSLIQSFFKITIDGVEARGRTGCFLQPIAPPAPDESGASKTLLIGLFVENVVRYANYGTAAT